jgi:hypothetical protein
VCAGIVVEDVLRLVVDVAVAAQLFPCCGVEPLLDDPISKRNTDRHARELGDPLHERLEVCSAHFHDLSREPWSVLVVGAEVHRAVLKRTEHISVSERIATDTPAGIPRAPPRIVGRRAVACSVPRSCRRSRRDFRGREAWFRRCDAASSTAPTRRAPVASPTSASQCRVNCQTPFYFTTAVSLCMEGPRPTTMAGATSALCANSRTAGSANSPAVAKSPYADSGSSTGPANWSAALSSASGLSWTSM